MEILKLLDRCPIVIDYEVEQFRSWEAGGFYRLRVEFSDKSILHAREYVDEEERSYSFHWMTSAGYLLIRWDNSPYHKHLSTYPHHKHRKKEVTASSPPDIATVLEIIACEIKKT